MSYSIEKRNNNLAYDYAELIADKKSDISILPTDFAAGSNCICIEDSSVYILGNDKVWHKL